MLITLTTALTALHNCTGSIHSIAIQHAGVQLITSLALLTALKMSTCSKHSKPAVTCAFDASRSDDLLICWLVDLLIGVLVGFVGWLIC
jgi:hypothetical protein